MLIRHQGGNRTEGFVGMHRRCFIRLRAEQQRRRKEGAGGVKIGLAARQNLASGLNQRVDVILYIHSADLADQRAHFYPFLRRVADGHFLQTGNQRFADRMNWACGTMMRRIAVHSARLWSSSRAPLRG